MSKKLILIVGLSGSGKSTVSNFIKKRFNADVFLSGDIVRDETKRRGLSYTPENDSKIAHWFNLKGRENLLVKRMLFKAEKSKKNLIVLEGFRSDQDLKYIKEMSKTKPFVIAIKAPFNVRARRLLKRKKRFDEDPIKYLRFRDKEEKGHGVIKLMKKADYTIDNSKLNKKQTNERANRIMKEILSSS
jgi:dephospho-CoA kinase